MADIVVEMVNERNRIDKKSSLDGGRLVSGVTDRAQTTL